MFDTRALLEDLGYRRLGVRVRRALRTWGADAAGAPVSLWRGDAQVAVVRDDLTD